MDREETLAAIATSYQVSVDWLIGISEEGQLGAEVMHESIVVEPGGLSPSDACLDGWWTEATGYKIRLVPQNFPDLLKSDEVIDFQYRRSASASPHQGREVTEARLRYQRRPETDLEVCTPIQRLLAFARGEGVWQALPAKMRKSQLRRMADLTEELYPRLRWFLYDETQRYSAPLTVFGPLRAVIYVGQMYFVLNSLDHIRVLTSHFDDLIRAAVKKPTEVIEFVARLHAEI